MMSNRCSKCGKEKDYSLSMNEIKYDWKIGPLEINWRGKSTEYCIECVGDMEIADWIEESKPANR